MNINYYDKPKESLETLLEKYNPKMYLVIEDVLSDPKGFELVFQQLIDIMKWGFEIKQIRHKLIHYKFKMSDKEMLCMPANNFISNLILWYPFMEMDKVGMLDETYIFDFSQHNIISATEHVLEKTEILGWFTEGELHSSLEIAYKNNAHRILTQKADLQILNPNGNLLTSFNSTRALFNTPINLYDSTSLATWKIEVRTNGNLCIKK